MRVLIAGLLGGLVVFLWGAVAHMMLPIGMMGFKVAETPAQESVLAAAKTGFTQGEGVYMLPMMPMDDFKDEAKTAAFGERLRANPYAMVIWQPVGQDMTAMGRQLGVQYATVTLGALLLAFVVSFALVSYGMRVILFTIGGLFAWLEVSVPFWNWYRFPMEFTIGSFLDHVIGWFLAGLVMAWWLGRGGR